MKQFLYLLVIMSLWIGSPILVQPETESEKANIKALEDSLKKEPENSSLLLKLGILYHDIGAAGNKEAVKKSGNVFERLIKLEPKNAEARCWYGSVLTMKGRDARFPFSKMSYVNKGIKEMDKAVEMAPDNIAARMTRANNALALPDFFNRTEVAITDLEYLISMKEKNPQAFDNALFAQTHLGLGRAYKKKGDLSKARENWQKALEIAAPDTKEAEEAKKLLKETEG